MNSDDIFLCNLNVKQNEGYIFPKSSKDNKTKLMIDPHYDLALIKITDDDGFHQVWLNYALFISCTIIYILYICFISEGLLSMSSILNDKEKEVFVNLLRNNGEFIGKSWNLIYKKSVDKNFDIYSEYDPIEDINLEYMISGKNILIK